MNILPVRARPLLACAAVAVAALSLTGCVVAPVGPYYRPYDDGPVVGVPPPPPQYETAGPPPVVGYVWMGGFWNWVGGRHVWVRGHWDAPRPGYRWAPHRWDRAPHGWRERPGHWHR